MDFGSALTAIIDATLAKEQNSNPKGMRLPKWEHDVVIKVQKPDENSKMTAPYLYVESRFGRVPWKETMIELFSKDWMLVEEGNNALAPNPAVLRRKLRLGEYRVGISFNPGGHAKVNEIKALAASFIDQIEGRSTEDAMKTGNDLLACIEKGIQEEGKTHLEVSRCYDIAIGFINAALNQLHNGAFTGAQNDMETAAMWAVKGATKPDVPEGGF